MKTINLRSGDIAVALQLAIGNDSGLSGLASGVFRSLGEVHNAISRLRAARLLLPTSREVATGPLTNFIRWGVPHAFPAVVGGIATGFATANLNLGRDPGDAPVAGKAVEFVWPDASGNTRGQALQPLYPNARKLVSSNLELYALLSLVDLVRIGGVREANAAVDEISRRLAARRRPAARVNP